ncbi:hypothetical protein ACKUZF_008040 [Proteus mirabilis]
MIQLLKETLSPLVDGRVFFQVLPEGKALSRHCDPVCQHHA